MRLGLISVADQAKLGEAPGRERGVAASCRSLQRVGPGREEEASSRSLEMGVQGTGAADPATGT